MSSPILGLLPKIPLPPFSRIPLVLLNQYIASSGQQILPYSPAVPGSGRLKIYVSVSQAGTLAIIINGNTSVPNYLNGGNALNVNTLYEFTIDDISQCSINFIWYSSSSSVSSAWINLYVFFEPDVGEESG